MSEDQGPEIEQRATHLARKELTKSASPKKKFCLSDRGKSGRGRSWADVGSELLPVLVLGGTIGSGGMSSALRSNVREKMGSESRRRRKGR